MRTLTWMGLGFSGALLLVASAHGAREQETVSVEPVLEIMSPDRGDCTLRLSWPWGAMAVNHVLLDDHRGPFRAVVESTGKGVRVRFEGWGKEPFVASADRELRVIYWVAGRKEIDFTADATSASEVRVRPADRPVIRGRRVVMGLGERAARGVPRVSVSGRAK